MDIVGLLSSLNKIALVAFLITLGFLIYELILLTKIGKSKTKPQVPKFQEGSYLLDLNKHLVESEIQKKIKKNKFALIILTGLLIFFGFITWIGYASLRSSRAKKNQLAPSPTIYRVIAKNNPSPTPEPIPTEIPNPTEIPTLTEAPTPTEIPITEPISPTIEETSTPSPSPTVIEQLPQTGYLNNLLILFSVAGLVIFFSFLF
ncbi:hypothetical protein A3A46_04205 [Candidatus Roizmanbacteria bacterium RIFCSPLOWO2_01_FULL_37_13]|uniref:Uncharacterized protein n=1 Tax=Candidatus Roizmanbacteria bacterium RIFCSPHIGHO2_02_FULL_38_11 TaxID=1802039 RepID=A0A1F7H1W7_9BACT|nr:MAG: hypothetical protein A3C25_03230 [Candidatus Roizmanbacteria bacterium RIFCSPHIGHO2_02_FULL_38_11]OGK34906.1 MAG: hypothetical protein A3F58_03715 [Candidatus Roizmanbacteria bacterium RIFCSPHIGHO2_12_FULL_37_9b]OGK40978.1 MAG: hypothetical protein A3A46_04205 [Candidatus Roizmanbacteria bacterium RIFCSPLOWO2_01_FULL_37_13]